MVVAALSQGLDKDDRVVSRIEYYIRGREEEDSYKTAGRRETLPYEINRLNASLGGTPPCGLPQQR